MVSLITSSTHGGYCKVPADTDCRCQASGWMWLSMTGCPPTVAGSYISIQKTTTSFGVLCWRKPMPSKSLDAFGLNWPWPLPDSFWCASSWLSSECTECSCITVARLHGSYEALKGGSSAEAMEDFTGGLVEWIDLRKAPENLLLSMLKGDKLHSLMGCSLYVSRRNENYFNIYLPTTSDAVPICLSVHSSITMSCLVSVG